MRWDKSTLHDDELSPRLAVVYAASSRHTVRATYGQAFQRPGLPEIFSRVPLAPPLDLSALEQALEPILDGVPLGFENIPLLAVGNSNLVVEEVDSVEVGYNGVLTNRVFVTASVYRNEIENFISGLLPQLGTSFGRLNPEFGPYAPPAALSDAATRAVLEALQAVLPPELFAVMSNDTDPAMSPIFALLSFTNFGRVETQGIELSLGGQITDRWSLDANYTYFDFEVKEDSPETPLLPNAPKHQVGLSLTYLATLWDGNLNVRWVDEMPFRSGIYVGPVPSYTVVGAHLGWRLSERWKFGLDVSNLFDNEHYQVFGGDVLGRRALVHTTWTW